MLGPVCVIYLSFVAIRRVRKATKRPGDARPDYEYDIFVSYKRSEETLVWLKEHFAPLLRHRVELELGQVPRLYIHEVTETIAPGVTWPLELGRVLGSSKVLIALWTRTYFNSVWCTEEMGHMLAREKSEGCRTAANAYGLTIPIVIHDGDEFPADLGHIQKLEFQAVYNTRMRRDSLLAEQLSDLLAQSAAGIAAAIRNAPPYREDWPKLEAKQFFDRYHRTDAPSQKVLPRFNQK